MKYGTNILFKRSNSTLKCFVESICAGSEDRVFDNNIITPKRIVFFVKADWQDRDGS